jgi:hypothetical protein
MPTRSGKRFAVRFGEPLPSAPSVEPKDDERLERALALLDELRLADFMPEEFHAEHDALKAGRQ